MRRLHRSYSSFRYGAALRRARGISLVVTVLLTMLAATIGLVVVRQSVLATREEAGLVDFARAQAAVEQVQRDFERQLANNPTFYLSSTFAYERPRLCSAVPEGLAPSVTASIESNPWLIPSLNAADEPVGVPWPCGDRWAYPSVGQPLQGWQWSVPNVSVRTGVSWVPDLFPTRAEIFPPSPSRPFLRLRVVAAVGSQETGVEVSYSRSAVSEWNLYSSQSLDMSEALGPQVPPTDTVTVFGPSASAYSNGRILLPTGFEQVTRSLLAAEQGFVGGAGDTSTRLVAPPELRNVVQEPLTMTSLRASAASLSAAACPDVAGDSVCLRPGQEILSANGQLVQVPDSPAFLIMPAGSSASPQLTVFAASQTPVFVSECESFCSPREASASLVSAGVHPGVLPGVAGASVWQEVGTFPYPSSGVVGSLRDTYVGSCPGSVLPGAGCEPVVFPESLTLWAGDLNTSADIYLSGSVAVSDSARIGLVASSQVRAAYWAAESDGQLTVDAALVSMGLGMDSSDALGSVPRVRPGVTLSEDASIQISGSLAGQRVVRPSAFTRLSVVVDEQLQRLAPPYMPGFSHVLQPTESISLSSSDVCPDQLGQDLPSGGSRTTCVGLW